MRRSIVTVVLGAAFLVGCSSSDGPVTTCGANTQSVNGVCETIVTCGDGTVLVNNVCQPSARAGACGEGTQNVDGLCVPGENACESGTRFVNGACVPDFEIVCGAGTFENDDGVCILDLDLDCGPGTVHDTVSDDEGTSEVAICNLECTGDQIYDEVADGCVDACVEGAEFDAVTNTCKALCADDEYYLSSSDECVHVPLCMRNSEDVSGDCLGWPFAELTLETLCARRAFNLCDPIDDPACSCDHAGDYLSLSDAGTLSEAYEADFAGCVMQEIFQCDILGTAFLRALESEGQITVDTDALEELDEYFALPEGVCTRPSDFDPLPLERFLDVIDGAVAADGECFHDLACADTHQCRWPVEDEEGLAPLVAGTCQAKIAADEFCHIDSRSRGFGFPSGIPAPPGNPTSNLLCLDGLLCLPSPREQNECQPPKVLGAQCNDASECQDGLQCFPADLDAINGPDYIFLNPSTCQAAQTEGTGCLADTRTINGVSVSLDVCASNLRCDDAARAGESDGVGQCVAAIGTGGTCQYCDEYQFSFFLGQKLAPFTQDPFSVCGGELVCTFERLVEGWEESCADEVSVCPPSFREVESPGGICQPQEFTCDDELDNDGDGFEDCLDSRDCCSSEACVEHENCVPR